MTQPRLPRYRLTVRVHDGLVVRDSPRSQSDGGIKVRTEPVGKVLMAYTTLWVGPVEYAQLVPQNPLRSEWVRVAEADNSVIYVDKEDLNPEEPSSNAGGSDLVSALDRLTAAIERFTNSK